MLPMQRDECRQQCRDHHKQGYRYAVRSSKRVGGAEPDDRSDARDREAPIHERDIDLAHLVTRGVDDIHARQEAQPNGLLRQRKSAGNYCLSGDDCRGGR